MKIILLKLFIIFLSVKICFGQVDFEVNELVIYDIKTSVCIDTTIIKSNNSIDTIINWELTEESSEPSLKISCILTNDFSNDTFIWLFFSRFYVKYKYLNKEYSSKIEYLKKEGLIGRGTLSFDLFVPNPFDDIWDGSYYPEKWYGESEKLVYRKDYTNAILQICPTIEIEAYLAYGKPGDNYDVIDDTYFAYTTKKIIIHNWEIQKFSLKWSKISN